VTRKIFLRFARPSDAERLLKDGVVSGAAPGRDGCPGSVPRAPAKVGAEFVVRFQPPINNTRAITQAKNCGFEEFRLMPEPGKMLAFFRNSCVATQDANR
jgi:hypothetical protein